MLRKGRTFGGHPDCQKVRDAVALCLAKAKTLFPTAFIPTEFTISFYAKGGGAGYAAWNLYSRTGKLEFSLEAVDKYLEDTLTDTVPHEVAHLLCFANSWDRGHGKTWKVVAKGLGAKPERCHKLELTPARNTSWYGVKTDSGQVLTISARHRNAILQGKKITVKWSGERLTPANLTGKVY